MEAAPPDGDGGTSLVVTFTEGSRSVNPVLDEFSNLYPNPAEDILYIENPSGDKFRYEIYSINGKLLSRRDQITGSNTMVVLSGYAKGVYCVGVISAEKTETHKPVIKQVAVRNLFRLRNPLTTDCGFFL